MPRNFNLSAISLPSADSLKEPRMLVRAGLGLLLAANLAAAAVALHLFGASPQDLDRQLIAIRSQLAAQKVKLNRSRLLAANIDRGRTQSETFLATYMTSRRHTYSTIISEITETAKAAGMKTEDWTIGIDPIEGSEDLDMMTISVNVQGGYSQLVKLVNMLDRSSRFLLIESMQATPQPKGDVLNVNFKLNTFVKDDTGA